MKTLVTLLALVPIATSASGQSYWHVSTFNADNLNSNGAGNHAMWCGVPESDPRTEGWFHPQGYGNNWHEILLYEATPANPSQPDTVELEFFFNYDYESGYGDRFTVEYDSAGTWVEVMWADDDDHSGPAGSNADELGVFHVPGDRFTDHATRAIEYSGHDYGASGDRISIRLRFVSKGAWSDEDGLWPTIAGAVQVDDLTITHAAGTFTEDFEGEGPWLVTPMRGESFTAAPAALQASLSVAPNPFNPTTQIRFNAPHGATGVIGVYGLRGELVRLLHRGEIGHGAFVWDGRDDRGMRVSSGVYVVRADSAGKTWTSKVALVK